MEDFRLLAVRPLQGCHHRFLKNLTAGHIYRFNNSVKFLNEHREEAKLNQEIFYIDNLIDLSPNFYSIKSADQLPLKINISAIAGRNGAGKSTLIELMFAAIYMLSVDNNILQPNLDSLAKRTVQLRADLRDLRIQQLLLNLGRSDILPYLISIIDDEREFVFEDVKMQMRDYIEKEESLARREKDLKAELASNVKKVKGIKLFHRQLKVEVYYQLGEVTYQLSINGASNKTGHIVLRSMKDGENVGTVLKISHLQKEELSKYFFYTIAVNYSHYALNANVMGDWINSLFHKNDGYTTPLVINPMRNVGNFDINKETVFAKYRLLSNALTEHFYSHSAVRVTDYQDIHKVRFTLNISKLNEIRSSISNTVNQFSGATREANMLIALFSRYFTGFDIASALFEDFFLKKELLNYIVDKVDRISELYPGFEDGYQFGIDAPTLRTEAFLDKLVADRTHVTNKLHQAVYFVKFILERKNSPLFRWDGQYPNLEDVIFEYTLEELITYTGLSKATEISRYIPPSIFNIDFILINRYSKSTSVFERLSSGEQQLIHTIQSVIYHLNNIQSVHSGGSERTKYNAVSVIYDEIELYFHPEYQRRFIKELTMALGRIHLKGLSRITAINILFLTHSPFILSDILSENTMLMEVTKRGKSITVRRPEQTFAANIHDLLADSFFLEGTLMGKFAEGKINDLIDRMKENKELSIEDIQLLKLIGDPYLRSNLLEFSNRSL